MNPLRAALLSALLACTLTVLVGCGSSGTARSTDESGTIESEELGRRGSTATRLSQLIDGRIPGVRILESGDGRVQIRMRGNTSFSGDDQVLVVLDDTPIDLDATGSIPGVVVSEIARIEAFNGPQGQARYGMRGANGVIVVTTKRGTGN